jgi:hypothetical protein
MASRASKKAKSKGKVKPRAKPKAKAKAKPKAKPRPKAKVKPKAETQAKGKARPKPAAPKPKGKPAAAKPLAKPARPATKAKAQRAPATAAGPRAEGAKPSRAEGRASSRRARRASGMRRGADGQTFPAGELLLPSGPQSAGEILYLLRGAIASEHPDRDATLTEVLAKKGVVVELERDDLQREIEAVSQRFDGGAIEPLLPPRPAANRRTFAGIVERAKYRRREIGAFLRGLDMGATEASHMDSHGEGSLQSLMEWAARLEILSEADEPGHADYSQFHRVLDQLESNTEALVVDVELTLRRLRDRAR